MIPSAERTSAWRPGSTSAVLARGAVLTDRGCRWRTQREHVRALRADALHNTPRLVARIGERTDRAGLTDLINGGGITVNVPPLRERADDIRHLAERFVATSCRSVHRSSAPRISPEALSILLRYAWPGNIRELRNVVERAVLLCEGDQLLPQHLPPKLSSLPPPASHGGTDPRSRLLQEMEQVERQRVIDALARCGGNQTQAAEVLGISRRTLVTRLGLLDLPRPRKGTRTT